MKKLEQLTTYGNWFLHMRKILEEVSPMNPQSWALRLNSETQSVISAYNLQLGILLVEARGQYKKLLKELDDGMKSSTKAKIHAEATEEYQVFKHLEQLHEDVKDVIYALRHEVKTTL